MAADAVDHVAEVGERVDVRELAGSDEAVDHGGSLRAVVGAGEHPVFSADGNGSQDTFGEVVVDYRRG